MEPSAAIAENIAPAQPAPDKIDYINLVKGFSRVFWGLALTAVLVLSQTRIDFFSVGWVPAYFCGTLLHGWGLGTLWRAGRISARWNLRLTTALALVLLEIYFFPFVRWWKMMPYISYFTVNVGLLVLAVIASLVISNLLAADFFRRLALKGERLEAQIYAFSVLFFMALPLLLACVFSIISAWHYQTVFYDEFIQAVYSVPLWFYVVLFVPYSLTLVMLWKARDRSYQRFCQMKNTA